MTKSPPSLGKDAEIDVNRLIKTRLLVQANSGGGKSWALRRLLEQTFGHVQHLVIDPDGEFHTLREKLPYVLAGKGGDTPATVETAALLARKLLELHASAIVDIFELGAKRPAFVAEFIGALMDAPRELWHPVMVVLDEAHKFCPETGKRRRKAEAETVDDCTAAVISLMDSGRKRGYCGVLATQRIAKLSKDAVAEVNSKLIGRTSYPDDQHRAGEELGMTSKDDRLALRELQPGHFFAYGPAFVGAGDVFEVTIGPVQTTHPEAGEVAPPPTPPPHEIRRVLAELADLPKEAAEEARTLEQLRRRVKELEAAQKRAPEPKVVEKVVERLVEKPTVPPAIAARALELSGEMAVFARSINQLIDAKAPAPAKASNRRPTQAPAPALETATSSTSNKPDEQTVLDAIATLQQLELAPTVLSVAAWIGVHPKTKTLLQTIGALRSQGLIEGLRLTGNGRAVARAAAPNERELAMVLSGGLTDGQRKILDVVATFRSLDKPATHLAIAAWLGVHPKTKTLLEDLGKLRSRGYLDGNALTELGALASEPRFRGVRSRDLIASLDDQQRSICELVLSRGKVASMTELADCMGVHPKTKSLLSDLGTLRSRGLLGNGWPLVPTTVFPNLGVS